MIIIPDINTKDLLAMAKHLASICKTCQLVFKKDVKALVFVPVIEGKDENPELPDLGTTA